MRSSVANIFPPFSEQYEGRTSWPYLDVRDIVTVGIGCAVLSLDDMHELPWNVSGTPATPAQVQDSWTALLAATPGMLADSYQSLTPIRLTEQDIDDLLGSRLVSDESDLRSGLMGYDDAPANAQLGVLSMAWAVGPYGVINEFPRFCAAFSESDWATCATQCHISDVGNPGLTKRNAANLALFQAAALGGDPDAVNWVRV